MRIVNEPTAAAMAYGIDKLKGMRNILVFDLGGGTFDVTILTVDNGVFEVLATNGDTHLGGEDIDKALVNYFIKIFKKRTGLQLKAKNHRAIQKLRHAVNQAKHVLSSEVSTTVQVDALFKGKDLDEKLTRANFEVTRLCVDGWSGLGLWTDCVPYNVTMWPPHACFCCCCKPGT